MRLLEKLRKLKKCNLQKRKHGKKFKGSQTPVCNASERCANSTEEASGAFKRIQETAERCTVPSQDMIDAMRYACSVAKEEKIEQIKRNAVPKDYEEVHYWADGKIMETVTLRMEPDLCDTVIEPSRPKTIRKCCAYCGCVSEKDYGTCAHCGAPL